MFECFIIEGLHHFDLYCNSIIEACPKSSIHFDCRYMEVRNACIISSVFIILNVRDGTESKYPSIVFQSILFILVINGVICQLFFCLFSTYIELENNCICCYFPFRSMLITSYFAPIRCEVFFLRWTFGCNVILGCRELVCLGLHTFTQICMYVQLDAASGHSKIDKKRSL